MYCDDMTEIYVPTYYGKFKCIAERCRQSCCINWEIPIDDGALSKYEKIPEIAATIAHDEDCAHFKLCENGRCPHLNEDGLCNIIISHGESSLADICRRHPRFYNLVDSRIEAGLGIVCREACRFILECEEPFSLSREVVVGEDFSYLKHALSEDFSATAARSRIFSVIRGASSFTEVITALRQEFMLPIIKEPDEWLLYLSEFEILDEEWQDRLQLTLNTNVPKSVENMFDTYYLRLLAYFVYRHVSAATSPDNLRARLGFSILSAEMIKHIFSRSGGKTLDDLIDVAREYSLEIEYSEENTAELIFEFECEI